MQIRKGVDDGMIVYITNTRNAFNRLSTLVDVLIAAMYSMTNAELSDLSIEALQPEVE